MSDLTELYHALILDHSRAPRNHREMPDASCEAEGRNPLCGDQLHVWLKLNDGMLEDVSFIGKGCAISQASASLMTMSVKGRSIDDAIALFDDFHLLVTGKLTGDGLQSLPPKLAAFSGVARFPVRVKCASLSWHALRGALRREARPVATE